MHALARSTAPLIIYHSNSQQRATPEGKSTPIANSASEYAAVRDCVSSLQAPLPNSQSQIPENKAIDTVGYGEVLHSAPKLQRVRSNNYSSKSINGRHQNQATSAPTYASVLDCGVMHHNQSSEKTAFNTATTEDSPPPPIPQRNLDVLQDLGYSVLPCNHKSDKAPQPQSPCRSSTGSVPTETAVEVAQ